VNVPAIGAASGYSVPQPRRNPPAETASDVSIVAAAAPTQQYVTKIDRDLVFEQTGQRIPANEIPIPPIALQIAAQRRAGVGTAHAYAQAVADPIIDSTRQVLRTQQSGLDVIA
jgi:hypothetical protein